MIFHYLHLSSCPDYFLLVPIPLSVSLRLCTLPLNLLISNETTIKLPNWQASYLSKIEAKIHDLVQFSTQNLMGSSKMSLLFTFGAV